MTQRAYFSTSRFQSWRTAFGFAAVSHGRKGFDLHFNLLFGALHFSWRKKEEQ